MPVVVAPSETSVLNFAAAQVRVLGADLEELLLLHSEHEGGPRSGRDGADDNAMAVRYAERAIAIAHGWSLGPPVGSLPPPYMRDLRDLRDLICSRKRLLFGPVVLDSVVDEWRRFLSRSDINC